jgi:CHAD domain-containing protein
MRERAESSMSTDVEPSSDGRRQEIRPDRARSAGRQALVPRYISAQVSGLRAGEAGIGSADPAAIHDTRVAVRRLRSTLRTFAPLFDRARASFLSQELRWFGGLLGAVRDSQVMAERLAAAVVAEPSELIVGPVTGRVRSELAAETARHLDELTDALGGARYTAMMASAQELADEVAPHAPRRCRRLARKALRRADRRLDEATVGDSADRDRLLHRARRAVKRARYAVEVLGPVDHRPAGRLARRLTALQDVLGANQDAVVTRQWLRAAGMRAHVAGENGFTYGLLYSRQDVASARSAADLARATRRARRRQVRHWLDR